MSAKILPTNSTIAPTTLQWEVDFEVDDYQRKEIKKAESSNPAFSLLSLVQDLFLKELLPPISYETNQPRTQKEHGGGFGYGIQERSTCNIIILEGI